MNTIRILALVAISTSIACSDGPDASPGTAQPETVPAAVVPPPLPPAPPPEAAADTEQAPEEMGEEEPGEVVPPSSEGADEPKGEAPREAEKKKTERDEAPAPKARAEEADEQPAPKPKPEDEAGALEGNYRFVGGQRERQQVEAAIEKVTDEMNFFVRRIAKRRLKGTNQVPSRITIARDGDAITVSFDERSYTATIGAAPVSVMGSNDEPAMLTHRMQGDRLVQRFQGEDGSRTNVFSVDEDGKLRMKATVAADQLPANVVYTLTFQR